MDALSLARLRDTIIAVVPDAEQCISYGMPAFRVRGKVVAGFAAFKNDLSYVPHSGSVTPQLGKELEGYTSTRGSLHFPVDEPLPEGLVRKLLAVRMEQAFGGEWLVAPTRGALPPRSYSPKAVSQTRSTIGYGASLVGDMGTLLFVGRFRSRAASSRWIARVRPQLDSWPPARRAARSTSPTDTHGYQAIPTGVSGHLAEEPKSRKIADTWQ